MNEDNDTVIPTVTSKLNDIFSFPELNHDCQAIHNVIKENILVNEGLLDSIKLVNSNLASQLENNSNIEPFIPLIAVVIGALIGFFINRAQWYWVENQKNKKSLFTKILILINELEALSVVYWTTDRCKDDVKNEVYIKSKINLLTKYVRFVDASQKTIKEELENFISDIFDLVTGDEFESNDRKASKGKAIKIAYRCADINASVSTNCKI